MAAANAVIGALRVVIGADTAALDKGLKDSQSKLSSFGSTMGKIGAGIGVAVAGAAVGVGVAVKGILEHADKLGKMAQSFGVPVEELSKLSYAATLSDVSLESLGKSLGILNKNMTAVASGAAGPAAQAFQALGISVKGAGGFLRSSSDVMADVATKFSGMNDGAAKTALAMAIFGKSGAALIPMLNAGATGLKEAGKEAEKFGLIIDTKTAKAAENFNDNMTRLGKISEGIITRFAAGLAPTLEKISNLMVNAAGDSKTMALGITVLDGVLKVLVSSGILTGQVFGYIADRVSIAAGAVLAVAKGDFAGAWETLKTPIMSLPDRVREAAAQIVAIWKSTANTVSGTALFSTGAGAGAAAGLSNFNAGLLATKNALDSYIDSTKKSIATQQADAMAVGMSAGARERLRVVMAAEAVALAQNITLTDANRIKISELGNAAQLAALQLQGHQLLMQNRTPYEQFNIDLESNRLALASVGATAEQVALANEKAAERSGFSWKQQVPAITGSFAEIASVFGESNEKMAKTAKILGAAQALISTYTGAAEALKLEFPMNLVAVAAVMAKGLGLVAAIKGTNVPKAQTGGNFMVPGGVGGGDRVLAPMMLEPGEMVSVTPVKDVGRGGEGSRTLRIPSINPRDFFSGDTMRALLEGIAAAQRDGYRLSFT